MSTSSNGTNVCHSANSNAHPPSIGMNAASISSVSDQLTLSSKSSNDNGITNSIFGGKTIEELTQENVEMRNLLQLWSRGGKRKAVGKNVRRIRQKKSAEDVNNDFQIRELCKRKIFHI